MRRIKETAWDDLDHDIEATRTDVELSWDGHAVNLDLSDASYELIAEALKPFLSVGVPVRKRGRGFTGQGKYAAMRAWGDKHGLGEGIGYLSVGAGYSYRGVLKEAYKAAGQSG